MKYTWIYLFIAAIILKAADVILTGIAINAMETTAIEFNPIMRVAMNGIGVIPTLVLGFLCIVFVNIYVILRLPAKKWLAPLITCIIYLPVAINNSYQLSVILGG